MNPLERVQAAAGRLKVFPLPSLVLFPGTAVPLHIFEPRYRALVRDALAGDGVLALAQVPEASLGQLDGDPPLHRILSAGVVSLHEELPDGRFNLMLTGVCRARLLAEHPKDKPYREVQAEMLPDPELASDDGELSLKRAVLELAARLPEKAAETFVKVASRARGGALADVVAATLVNNVAQRLALLDELDGERRLAEVLKAVTAAIARMKAPPNPGGYLN
ncbi:MAG: LON peptidase substrate-binding domain-containing protein [Archangiaceae bacterium]|nr:LON peptidase substrate-binding domain-containing protein [Archangiaceae bacterium]